MSKKQKWSLVSAVFLFVALLGLALLFESELFIYAASAIPILIVMTLPDIKQHQYIQRSKAQGDIQVYKVANGDEPLLVISFQPGFVRWHCKKLYFDINELHAESIETLPADGDAASIPVLSFDLSAHPRRTGWFGINLAQLSQRTVNLSYTTQEVNRFIVHMKDLESIALTMMTSATPLVTNNSSNNSNSLSA
ncbi:hypothetical protein SAMN03159341_10863 [Paenibacillus sp. 1_12]|uniref:hypothetical protein n=1 Tax=Paenibacillus sp. 1_12 TaxID=1566278 RepID=UPI0008E3DF69|nr:hypothetical protein [Paenibacillus sp. 1_12]SFL64976.1 hypothetical protein SAMN03159341_10863 [Paenibacillus sp. 1_12]